LKTSLDDVGFEDLTAATVAFKRTLKGIDNAKTFDAAGLLWWRYAVRNVGRILPLSQLLASAASITLSTNRQITFEAAIAAAAVSQFASIMDPKFETAAGGSSQLGQLQEALAWGAVAGCLCSNYGFNLTVLFSSLDGAIRTYLTNNAVDIEATGNRDWHDVVQLCASSPGQFFVGDTPKNRTRERSIILCAGFLSTIGLAAVSFTELPVLASSHMCLNLAAAPSTLFVASAVNCCLDLHSRSDRPTPSSETILPKLWLDHVDVRRWAIVATMESQSLRNSLHVAVPKDAVSSISLALLTARTKATSVSVIHKKDRPSTPSTSHPSPQPFDTSFGTPPVVSSSPSSNVSFFDTVMASRVRSTSNAASTPPTSYTASSSQFHASSLPSNAPSSSRNSNNPGTGPFASPPPSAGAGGSSSPFIEITSPDPAARRLAESLVLCSLAALYDQVVPVSRRNVFVLLDVPATAQLDSYFCTFSRVWETPCLDAPLRGSVRRILSLRLLDGNVVRSFTEQAPSAVSIVSEASQPALGPLIDRSRSSSSNTAAPHSTESEKVEEAYDNQAYSERSTHYRRRRDFTVTNQHLYNDKNGVRDESPPKNDRLQQSVADVPWLTKQRFQTPSATVRLGTVDMHSLYTDILYLFRLTSDATTFSTGVSLGKLTWLEVPAHISRGTAANLTAFPALVCTKPPIIHGRFDHALMDFEMTRLLTAAASAGYNVRTAPDSSSALRVEFRVLDRLCGLSWHVDLRNSGDQTVTALVSVAALDNQWACVFSSSGRTVDRQLYLDVHTPAVFRIHADLVTREQRASVLRDGMVYVRHLLKRSRKLPRKHHVAQKQLDSWLEEASIYFAHLVVYNASTLPHLYRASENVQHVQQAQQTNVDGMPRAFGVANVVLSRRFLLVSTRIVDEWEVQSPSLPNVVLQVRDVVSECGQVRERAFEAGLVYLRDEETTPGHKAQAGHVTDLSRVRKSTSDVLVEDVIEDLEQLAEASEPFRWFRGM
jgi:hypothetical protein